jgi:hypothetical protein
VAALGEGREVGEMMDVSEHFPFKRVPQIDFIECKIYFEKKMVDWYPSRVQIVATSISNSTLYQPFRYSLSSSLILIH